jgi:hypothetical protein
MVLICYYSNQMGATKFFLFRIFFAIIKMHQMGAWWEWWSFKMSIFLFTCGVLIAIRFSNKYYLDINLNIFFKKDFSFRTSTSSNYFCMLLAWNFSENGYKTTWFIIMYTTILNHFRKKCNYWKEKATYNNYKICLTMYIKKSKTQTLKRAKH